MIKRVIFDYGRVLAYPTTGNWFITPNTKKILGLRNIIKCLLNYKKVGFFFRKAYKYLNENHLLHTEKEEIEQFRVFYKTILEAAGIKRNIDKISVQLAEDIVLNTEKVIFFDDVQQGLYSLSQSYSIAILSDTWPSLRRILEQKQITPILDGLIMSCDYGICKDNVKLFHIAISMLNIEPSNTVFVDDSESNLENAEKVGLIPILMDRKGNKKESKYPIVHNLDEVKEFIEQYNKK